MQYTTDFYPKIRLSPSSSNAVRYYGKQVRSRYLNESPRQKTYKYWKKVLTKFTQTLSATVNLDNYTLQANEFRHDSRQTFFREQKWCSLSQCRQSHFEVDNFIWVALIRKLAADRDTLLRKVPVHLDLSVFEGVSF